MTAAPWQLTVDIAAGQREWRDKINGIIDLYGEGYLLRYLRYRDRPKSRI